MAAILSHWIGIKAAIPVMTCALLFSHGSRVILYLGDTKWQVVKRVLIFSTPGIVLGAFVFSYLSGQTIALIMAIFLTLSFPIKAYVSSHEIKTSPGVLATASSFWGFIAGNVIGPGFFLAPFCLGTGMNRLNFVGSLATIVLFMNLLKLTVFGVTELMNLQLLTMGIFIGLITIPGNWLGREVLKKMTDIHHRAIVDLMTVLVIVNFIYLSFG